MHEDGLRSKWLVPLIQIIGIGLLTGVLTSRGQTYIPGPARQFANSYAMWLTVSFLVGLLLPSRIWAVVGGAVVQFAALVGYYAASQFFFGAPPGGVGIVLFWGVGGLLGGPVLGLAGYWWRRSSGRYLFAACALPGAVFLSEGLYLRFALDYDIAYAFLLVGIALPILLARKPRRAIESVALAIPLGIVLYFCVRYGFGFLYDQLTSR